MYHLRMATLWQDPKYGTFYVLYQQNGKSHRKALCPAGSKRGTKDKRTAKRLLNQFQRDLIAGKVKGIKSAPGNLFFEYCDKFLHHVDQTKTASTYRLYSVALDKAKASWGNIPLSMITRRHVDSLIADMVRAGLSIPTVNKNFRHIKGALNTAYDWELIKTPIRFPKQIKEQKQIRFLSSDELRKLLSTITDPEFSDFCLLSACTGLRSGELLRLTWADIDNPEGFIHVISEQKNKEDSRIPINGYARDILNRQNPGSGKVFRFNTLSWISQKFKQYARKAGLPNARFHDMRHTFASHMAMAGESPKAIQDLMRHESIASTMVYAKLSPDHLKEVSNRLNFGPLPVPSGKGGK